MNNKIIMFWNILKKFKKCIEKQDWAASLKEYITTTAILLDQVKLIIERLDYVL